MRRVADVPLVPEIAAWAEAGVRVVLCLSSDDASALPFAAERRRVYMQYAIISDLASAAVPNGALIFAAGPEPMLVETRAWPSDAPSDAPLPSHVAVVTNV